MLNKPFEQAIPNPNDTSKMQSGNPNGLPRSNGLQQRPTAPSDLASGLGRERLPAATSLRRIGISELEPTPNQGRAVVQLQTIEI